MFRKAFTLIELLIVVAIIAILAAIAVPNLLQAQTRAKVAKCVAQMRTIANAVEIYRMDNHEVPISEDISNLGWPYLYGNWLMISPYPPPPFVDRRLFGSLLTTPVSYLSAVPFDPFNSDLNEFIFQYRNATQDSEWAIHMSLTPKQYEPLVAHQPVGDLNRSTRYKYIFESCGPNLTWESQGIPNAGGPIGPYDPTNGAISNGNIIYYDVGGFTHLY